MSQINFFFQKDCQPCAEQKKELKKLGKGFKIKKIDVDKSKLADKLNIDFTPTIFIKGKKRTAKVEGVVKSKKIKEIAKNL